MKIEALAALEPLQDLQGLHSSSACIVLQAFNKGLLLGVPLRIGRRLLSPTIKDHLGDDKGNRQHGQQKAKLLHC